MEKFPQVPGGSVIVQNFPNEWYYSDFVPVDGKLNPGGVGPGAAAAVAAPGAPYGRLLPVPTAATAAAIPAG